MAHHRSTIKVFCKEDGRTLARYSWSGVDGVWVRSDRHGSEKDWFIRLQEDGTMQGYPRPVFECACGRKPVYTHDELQEKIAEALRKDERLLI